MTTKYSAKKVFLKIQYLNIYSFTNLKPFGTDTLLQEPSPVKYNVAIFLLFNSPFAYIMYPSTMILSSPWKDPIRSYVISLLSIVFIIFKYSYSVDTDNDSIGFSTIYP